MFLSVVSVKIPFISLPSHSRKHFLTENPFLSKLSPIFGKRTTNQTYKELL